MEARELHEMRGSTEGEHNRGITSHSESFKVNVLL